MYFLFINKTLTERLTFPMRKIVQSAPCFFLNLTSDQKIISQYRDKYNSIDRQLDKNPAILNMFHKDLRRFGSSSGRGAHYSSEQVLRMCIVMFIEQLSLRDTIIRVAESDFLRNFTRIGMGKVMSFALLCDAFKVVKESTWKKINDTLLTQAYQEKKISGERLRIDSTVCETNIHYPTDTSLLWDVYRVISRLIQQCNELEPRWNMGNRFHIKKIKRLYTYISTHANKQNKSTKRNVKNYCRTLVQRVDSICTTGAVYSAHARKTPTLDFGADGLLTELEQYVELGKKVVVQSSRSIICEEKVPASERIFSIFEEHTELFKRGKSRKPYEFGHLVTLGQTAEKVISFYNVASKSQHDTALKDIALESHGKSFGQYPREFTADKNYYTSMQDITEWEKNIDCVAIGKKGRRNQVEYEREHSDVFMNLQKFRAGIEGTISVLKRAFGLRRCRFKGFKGFAAAVGCLVFCHNLVLLARL